MMRHGWKTRMDERVYFEKKFSERSARIFQSRMLQEQMMAEMDRFGVAIKNAELRARVDAMSFANRCIDNP